jgi:hypothetical protein
MSIIEKILLFLFNYEDIVEGGKLYLRRWFLYPLRPGGKKDVPRFYLHKFYSGDDHRDLHDHPWSFQSIILRGGYWEHRANPQWQLFQSLLALSEQDAWREAQLRNKIRSGRFVDFGFEDYDELSTIMVRHRKRDELAQEHPPKTLRTWYGPLSLLRRGARWTHSVELPERKTAWTLVRTGTKEREWGFHTIAGWCFHKNYKDGICWCGDTPTGHSKTHSF